MGVPRDMSYPAAMQLVGAGYIYLFVLYFKSNDQYPTVYIASPVFHAGPHAAPVCAIHSCYAPLCDKLVFQHFCQTLVFFSLNATRGFLPVPDGGARTSSTLSTACEEVMSEDVFFLYFPFLIKCTLGLRQEPARLFARPRQPRLALRYAQRARGAFVHIRCILRLDSGRAKHYRAS